MRCGRRGCSPGCNTAMLSKNFRPSRPFSLRIGQLAADDEFLTSATSGGLINGTFGWAAMLAANMISGGPAYPLATPGVRIASAGRPTISRCAARSSRAIRPERTATTCRRSATATARRSASAGGALLIGEMQYAVNQGKQATGTAGALQSRILGVRRRAIFSRPAVSGGSMHAGNWGVYGVADQMVWRGKALRASNLFLRAGTSPSDRNLVSCYVDGGCRDQRSSHGPTGRHAHVRRRLSEDQSRRGGSSTAMLVLRRGPIRSNEIVFELSYAGAARAVVDAAAGHSSTSCIRAETCRTQTMRWFR